jgi:uncharacterized repeat protein (TIGR03847 family)
MSTDMGPVTILGVDAVGEPGQRRFRLYAQAGSRSAIMWMEKEQLNMLSLALDRALAQLTDGKLLRTLAQAGPKPEAEGMPASFPGHPSFEFQVGQIRIGYDQSRDLLALIASPIEILLERGQEPRALIREDESVAIFFTLQQAHTLTSSVTVLVASGRPVCPLCNAPLDGGPHACAPQNGHRQILQELVEDDELEDE